MARRLRCGMRVLVDFYDHSEDSSDPERFLVYGEVGKITRRELCLDCWAYYDPKIPHDDNEKRFTILRSTINAVGLIEVVEWIKRPKNEDGAPGEEKRGR